MKIALVHDYLTQRGGAERVFELLCQRYLDADVFTSLYDPENTIDLSDRIVHTTRLQNVPGAKRHFRLMAPFYYPAFRSLDLQDYDLIISSSTSFAKAVKKRADAVHICFCHNVTRFLWDTHNYLKEYPTYRKFYPLLEQIFRAMRRLDLAYAQEPDMYIANSSVVAHRIQSIYGKPATVVNYPIDSHKFCFSDQKEDFYLASARLMGYKRVDLIVEAFNWLGWNLLIMGDGPERDRLQSKALDNIKFLGYVSDAERTYLMSKTRAVVVAALEDYGLVPLEANASGTPVVGYGCGGILDTQVPGETAIFFHRQTPEAIQNALLTANETSWNYQTIHDRAMNEFSEDVFFHKIDQVIHTACHLN